MVEMQRTRESVAPGAPENEEMQRQAPVSIEGQQAPASIEAERQAPAAEAQQFSPTQTRPLNDTKPPDPVFKGAAKGGKLLKQKKEDIYATHSDRQRLGIKGVVADSAAMDLRDESLPRELRRILSDIEKYGAMDVTAKSSKEVLKEGALLAKIRGDLAAYMGKLTNAESKEYRLAKMYTDYFALSADGYLQVPEQESETVRKVGFPDPVEVDFTKEEVIKSRPVYRTDKNGKKRVVKQFRPRRLEMRSAKDESLFPHEPSINDIRQGSLGDCYLLAALASLVNVNPQLIKDCMRDNGDGTVTARFYKQNKSAAAGAAQAPVTETHYVRVPKTVPQGDKFAKGSLWVQMIEKAYAASGLKREDTDRDRILPTYADIAGGSGGEFLFAMTGKKETVIHRRSSVKSSGSYLDFMFNEAMVHYNRKYEALLQKRRNQGVAAPFKINPALLFAREFLGEKSASVQLSPEELQLPEKEQEARLKVLREERMERDLLAIDSSRKPMEAAKLHEKIYALSEFLKTIKTAADAVGRLKRDASKAVSYYSDALRREDMEAAIKNADFSALPDDLFTADEKEKIKARLFARCAKAEGVPILYRAFSGQYSREAEGIYDDINAALGRGEMVTAETMTYKPKDVAGADGLNSEHLSGGIAQGHAYTVLGVETRGDHRLVRLRNPWGTGTVSYSRKGKTQEADRKLGYEDNEGFFLMELNDFIAAFSNITSN
jgi:hypothetical protein